MPLLRTILIIPCVLIVAATMVAAIFLNGLTQNIQHFDLGDPAEDIPQIGSYEGGINILLIGSDTRNGQSGHYGTNPGSSLNDVNILFHVNAQHTNATVVSFPRDTFVNMPQCKTANGETVGPATDVKLNSILSDGGIRCIRDTVENLTSLKIPYVGFITFDGVVKMSNAIGGVQVCVAKAIDDDYTGLHLAKGEHTLQGTQALEFLRTRHGVGDGSDLTRISSQQVFLSSLVRKLKSNAVLTDPTRLYALAGAAQQSIELSTSLDNLDTLVSIAQILAPINLDNIVFIQYPTAYVADGVAPNAALDAEVNAAIASDKNIRLTATDTSGDASLPGSVIEKGNPGSSPSPSATSTPQPSASASTGPGTVKLPSDVYGTAASQKTCSVGNDLGHRD